MAQVTSQGLTIHYEIIGDGPPLLMHHGTMGSGAGWNIEGYLDDLKDEFRLILIDARGHGRSDKPHDPDEYEGQKFARDVIAVIDDLDLAKVIFWGYSLGARVGYELANIAPDRVSAFILGGGSPYASDLRVPVEGDENDPATVQSAVLGLFGMTAEAIPDVYKDVVLSNDFIAVRASLRDRPSIENALANMTMPCLIYVGEEDARLEPSERVASQLHNAKLVRLPGLDHMGALVMKDMVMPHVKDFLGTLS